MGGTMKTFVLLAAASAVTALVDDAYFVSSKVAGMDVLSTPEEDYDKVVILLHGGGGSGLDWIEMKKTGDVYPEWYGNITGIKFVFPTSPFGSQAKGAVWFNTYKNGCGYADDCAYDIPSIEEAASSVAELIEQEKKLLGGDASKVFLGGFSEGAQMAGYMQLAKLDYALGGTIIMDGFPIPPLCDMPGATSAEAKKNASYYGEDMKFMLWWGNSDKIFPVDYSFETWHGVFDALGIQSTLKVEHTQPLQGHTIIETELNQVMDFVRSN